LKVLKFGGTSVQDAKAIANVVRIVESRNTEPLVVVTSACAGATNSLLGLLRSAAEGDFLKAGSELEALYLRHETVARELIAESHREDFTKLLRSDCRELEKIVKKIARERKASDRQSDAIVSHGERWSSNLLTFALLDRLIPAVHVDSTEYFVTTEEFTNATPLFDVINTRAREVLLPFLAEETVVVTQGFVGISLHGRVTTIGRGGSDYSASIIGAALGVREIEIWTDTDGILSADPRIVPDALSIRELSVEEATELAHYGAKVIHPSTLAPAMESKIPVRILNSHNPTHPGTLVNQSHDAAHLGVKSITGRKGVCSIALRKNKRLNTVHFVHHIFDVLERYKKGVEFVSSSETGVLLVTSDDRHNESLLSELRHHEGAEIYEREAIVSVVGTYARGETPIQSKVHAILTGAGISVHLSYEGISVHSTAFVIDSAALEDALKLLHRELIEADVHSGQEGLGARNLHHEARVAVSTW
jgi:aspartate kinase